MRHETGFEGLAAAWQRLVALAFAAGLAAAPFLAWAQGAAGGGGGGGGAPAGGTGAGSPAGAPAGGPPATGDGGGGTALAWIVVLLAIAVVVWLFARRRGGTVTR